MSKIQLTIANKLIYSIDNDEGCCNLFKNDNIEIMIGNQADEVIK